jgi:NAD(P)-dependent dehydrogenase (short-subunit alcohol dehydrogenase family)
MSISTDERQHTVVVIGGASGIGAATAELLSGDHTVVVADLNPVAQMIVDVSDEASVQALFESVVEQYGGFDAVVNCAGVSALSAIVEQDAADFRGVIDVCLTGAFLVLKHAGARIDDGGTLVSLSSLNARQPGTGMAAYCAAKAGLVMLTQVAALELAARRIRVNSVSPVINFALSEIRNRIAAAISAGSPLRPSGVFSR